MTHYVFIDANILLSIYDYTDDDLDKLSLLADAIKSGKIIFYNNFQLQDEYHRNRESKIFDVLQRINGNLKISMALPRICDGFDEKDSLLSHLKNAESAKAALLDAVRAKAKTADLKADHLVRDILASSKFTPFEQQILDNARLRRDQRRLPGKQDSLGDQINWECLLKYVPNNLPLHIVSKDKDWSSVLSPEEIHPHLSKEWADSKASSLTLVTSLGGLLKLIDVNIVLSNDPEKDDYVQKLNKSGNFSNTHSVISKLWQYDSFNPTQVALIVDAFFNNSQVGWLAHDDDVNSFYKKFLSNHAALISADDADMMSTALSKDE